MESINWQLISKCCAHIRRETRLLQATVVSGNYAFKATDVRGYQLFVTQVVYQKMRATNWWLIQNVWHILGQENIFFMVNKVTTGYCTGYHIFLLQLVCHERKPQTYGSYAHIGSGKIPSMVGFCLFGENTLVPFQKCPPISLGKMPLFKMPLFARAFWIREFSQGI